MTEHDFPADENGDVLRRMRQHGDDLSKPRDIEFFFIFPDKEKAMLFAVSAETRFNFRTTPGYSRERNLWETVTTIFMTPTHSSISGIEAELAQLAQEFNGESEGWGCMQVD
jgi:hypothetical protein